MKLFEGRGDVRPTAKAENEPGAYLQFIPRVQHHAYSVANMTV